MLWQGKRLAVAGKTYYGIGYVCHSMWKVCHREEFNATPREMYALTRLRNSTAGKGIPQEEKDEFQNSRHSAAHFRLATTG